MRKQIVAGNWKMNKDLESSLALASELAALVKQPKGEVVIAPPFPMLHAVGNAIKGNKHVQLAAQNMHQETSGAFTGEVSADMLVSVGAQWVIIGHSERREYFKESNEQLARKVDLALAKGLKPIFCCGEPLSIRERDTHVAYVSKQLRAALFHLPESEFRKVVIAYEPIWAIGTGRTASSAQAQDMHASIRRLISRNYGKSVASDVSILYGGSCKPDNAKELFSQPDVDGGLIGGAALKASDFVAIIDSMQ